MYYKKEHEKKRTSEFALLSEYFGFLYGLCLIHHFKDAWMWETSKTAVMVKKHQDNFVQKKGSEVIVHIYYHWQKYAHILYKLTELIIQVHIYLNLVIKT